MASGFFALLDDVATLLDDVAAMSKIAAKKTAGILGDDLAVNSEKASGYSSSREIPILWKITKGSFINKAILLPITFLLSYFFPAAITPILLIGGAYLAYEGAEKIYHFLFHGKAHAKSSLYKEMTESELLEYEEKKIKSAILVDFILSAEIVIIALSTVVGQPIDTQIIVVTVIAIIATVGVYGIVALIVRMDDFGLKLIVLSNNKAGVLKTTGQVLVNSLPYVIKALAVIGTLAMILVAGGIFAHNIHFLHSLFSFLPAILGELIIGLSIGFVVLLVINLFSFLLRKIKE